jgi:hydrogenase maturation protein HypF
MRTDDSVTRVVRGRPTVLRRSRGLVPGSLPLECPRPVLACGAELMSTFCVAKGSRAWVSHHIGDLQNAETLLSFRDGVAHFEELFDVVPGVVAHDLHPDYLSTAYALEREGVDLVGVQHHHAHLAACLAEHGRGPDQRAVGAIYDGTGYGTDGTVWGGELLSGGLARSERAGHLWPVRMPGGEAAIRAPWRMACAWLVAALPDEPGLPAPLAGRVDPGAWRQVAALARRGVASPVTTSAGRLFDAIATLCGVRTEVTYEGQAAIELEALADRREGGAYPLPLLAVGGLDVLDARPTVRAVVADLDGGAAPALVAARFHNGLADATAAGCLRVAERRGARTAVLSGGAFANRRLLERTAAAVSAGGLEVLVPERLPPNDGGIAYGQAAVAAAREAAR